MATATRDEQAAPTAHTAAGASAPDAAATAPPPRIRVGALLSASSALLLLVVMFVTEWYGVAGVPDPSAARPAISTAENGWNGLTIIRWVLLATILVALGAVALHISQRRHGAKTDTSRVVAAMGLLSSGLLIYRVLIVLPSGTKVIDQKLGAFLGLVCALGIAWGGCESILEQRARAAAGAQGRKSRTSPLRRPRGG
jgi:hypothetical protein